MNPRAEILGVETGSDPCGYCGHRHAGPQLKYICIGCPCEWRLETSSTAPVTSPSIDLAAARALCDVAAVAIAADRAAIRTAYETLDHDGESLALARWRDALDEIEWLRTIIAERGPWKVYESDPDAWLKTKWAVGNVADENTQLRAALAAMTEVADDAEAALAEMTLARDRACEIADRVNANAIPYNHSAKVDIAALRAVGEVSEPDSDALKAFATKAVESREAECARRGHVFTPLSHCCNRCGVSLFTEVTK